MTSASSGPGALQMAREDIPLKRIRRIDRELGLLSRALYEEESPRLEAVADRVEGLRQELERIERLYLASVRPRFSRHLRTALRLAGEPDSGGGVGLSHGSVEAIR